MNKHQDKPSATVVWPERLVAYVDGELPAELIPEVEASIAADPKVRSMLEDLKQSRHLLRAAFADPHPASGHRPAPRKGRRRSAIAVLATAAAVVLVLAVRAGPLSNMPDSEIAYLHDEVAAYHTVYMTETRHLVEVPASQQEHIEEWLGGRLNGPLNVPDLQQEGFTFAGARLLTLGTVPVAQLMYQADGRLPIAVCIAAAQEENRGPTADRHHGLGIASWVRAGQIYMVVGDLSDEELSAIVRTILPTAET